MTSTLDPKAANRKTVLILADDARRDPLARAFKKDGYKTHFTGAADQVVGLLLELDAGAFVHDWPTIDATQAVKFQQRLGKLGNLAPVCRVVANDGINAKLAAMAVDCGVKRVANSARGPAGVVADVTMALTSMATVPELQQMIYAMQSGATYDQKTVDKGVTDAYRLYPHDPVVQLEFGNLCLRERRLGQAKAIAESLLKDDGQNVRVMNLLGRVYAAEGNADQAIETLSQADRLSPFNPDRLVMLGDMFFTKGDKAQAARCFDDALSVTPENGPARKGLVTIKLDEGDINAVLTVIQNATSEDETASLFNNAAIFSAKAGKSDQSLKLYEAALNALKTPALKASVHFNMALAYERLKDVKTAMHHAEKSLRLRPDFEKAARLRLRLTQAKTPKAS